MTQTDYFHITNRLFNLRFEMLSGWFLQTGSSTYCFGHEVKHVILKRAGMKNWKNKILPSGALSPPWREGSMRTSLTATMRGPMVRTRLRDGGNSELKSSPAYSRSRRFLSWPRPLQFGWKDTIRLWCKIAYLKRCFCATTMISSHKFEKILRVSLNILLIIKPIYLLESLSRRLNIGTWLKS